MTNRIAVTLELPDETVAVLRQAARREGMDLSTAVSVAVIAGTHEPAQAMRMPPTSPSAGTLRNRRAVIAT